MPNDTTKTSAGDRLARYHFRNKEGDEKSSETTDANKQATPDEASASKTTDTAVNGLEEMLQAIAQSNREIRGGIQQMSMDGQSGHPVISCCLCSFTYTGDPDYGLSLLNVNGLAENSTQNTYWELLVKKPDNSIIRPDVVSSVSIVSSVRRSTVAELTTLTELTGASLISCCLCSFTYTGDPDYGLSLLNVNGLAENSTQNTYWELLVKKPDNSIIRPDVGDPDYGLSLLNVNGLAENSTQNTYWELLVKKPDNSIIRPDVGESAKRTPCLFFTLWIGWAELFISCCLCSFTYTGDPDYGLSLLNVNGLAENSTQNTYWELLVKKPDNSIIRPDVGDPDYGLSLLNVNGLAENSTQNTYWELLVKKPDNSIIRPDVGE
ncbi:hypothetical protein GBF38_000047, partial [Nibea albiflora]